MDLYLCPNCKSPQFQRIESIAVDAEGKAMDVISAGVMRCADCGLRVELMDDNSLMVMETAPQATRTVLPRVRSSVSAEERGMIPNDKRRVL